MDNNKNRLKDRPKSKAEMRKMYFEHGSELGIENGLHIGAKIVDLIKQRHKSFIIK